MSNLPVVQSDRKSHDVNQSSLPPIYFLAPVDNNIDNLYFSKLKEALNNNLVKNIAITGIYGAGKSSLLNSFKNHSKKESPQYIFLDISLSTFNLPEIFPVNDNSRAEINTEPDNHSKIDNETLQLIERSILQQLFYQVRQSEIPFSRFKRIVTPNKIDIAVYTVATLSLFFSFLVITDEIDKFITLEAIEDYAEWFLFLLYGSTGLLIGLLVYQAFSYTAQLTEIKFSFHDTEFNVKNEQNKSILNDHLDEIIYFFESTKYNVLIIEDLDRFDNLEIFIRLREMNNLINKALDRKITFIYAIKDDLFQDKDRTKFFDIILPVIPVIDHNNAYDTLVRNHPQITESLDKKFLGKVSLYFDDYRLLLNIINEFYIFKAKLGDIGHNLDKLFAMVTYKNFYPREFARISNSDGQENISELSEIFTVKKNRIKKELSEQLNNEKESLNNELLELQAEKKFDEQSLVKEYINQIFIEVSKKNNEPISYLNIRFLEIEDASYLSVYKSIDDALTLSGQSLAKNFETSNIIEYKSHGSLYQTTSSLSEIEIKTNSKKFSERFAIIEKKKAGSIMLPKN